MKVINLFSSVLVFLLSSLSFASATRQTPSLADNAALRYWAAFSQMQDSAITAAQAQELNTMLDGTTPYDDSKYNELVEKNRPALETMQYGTAISRCDWGLDYQRGDQVPVDYVRRALTLGRLNVLHTFHLSLTGDKDGAVRSLAAGLRFSQDVAKGGPLFATLVAKDLLTTHFRAIEFLLHVSGLSPTQRTTLQNVVAQIRPTALDWQSAAKRDLDALHGHFSRDPDASSALTRLTTAYVAAIDDPNKLPALQKILAGTPSRVSELIPNASRILEQEQQFSDQIQQVRSILR